MILSGGLKQRKKIVKKFPKKPLKTILTPHKPYRKGLLWLTFWQKSAFLADTPVYSSAPFQFFNDRIKTFRRSCEQNDNSKPCFLVLFAIIPANGRMRANLRMANLAFWQIVYLNMYNIEWLGKTFIVRDGTLFMADMDSPFLMKLLMRLPWI